SLGRGSKYQRGHRDAGEHTPVRPHESECRSLAETPLGIVGRLREPLDDLGELLEALVGLAVLARRVARVDALEDDGELPVSERDVIVDPREISPRFARISLAHLLA